jgi:hypothetical protein
MNTYKQKEANEMDLAELNKICVQMLNKGQYEADLDGIKISITKADPPKMVFGQK